MKNLFYKLSVIFTITSLFISCDWLKNEFKDSTTFSFTLTCTEDLLDFVTPTATFVDNKGITQSVELSKEMFTNQVDSQAYTTLIINGDTIESLYWRQIIEIPEIDVSRDMTITYKIKANHPEYNYKEKYALYHNLIGSMISSGRRKVLTETSANAEINENIVVDANKLEETLKQLEEAPDYLKFPQKK